MHLAKKYYSKPDKNPQKIRAFPDLDLILLLYHEGLDQLMDCEKLYFDKSIEISGNLMN